MLKKIKIAIDMDDVLADSTTFWHGEVNRRTGAKIPKEAYLTPDDFSGFYERLWQKHKIDHLISVQDLDEHQVKDQSSIQAYKNSLEVLKHLSERYELCIVTARNSDQDTATRHWLNTNYPGLFKEVEFASDPQRNMVKTKGEICKAIGASWLIDDNPANCLDALVEGVNTVLFGEYGWHHNAPEHLVRCKDWLAVLEFFDGQSR